MCLVHLTAGSTELVSVPWQDMWIESVLGEGFTAVVMVALSVVCRPEGGEEIFVSLSAC